MNATVPIPDIAVAMACHNRRKLTLRCLESLFTQTARVTLNVFLVDDGSNDGTHRAVARHFPHVSILRGDGNLYWNGAMHLALEQAQRHPRDFFLWLNDDVILHPHALEHLLSVHGQILKAQGIAPIVVGSFAHPKTGKPSYGGQRRISSWHPLRLGPAYHPLQPAPCHTFQGNGILIPAQAVARIGSIDPVFSGFQEIGDTDYGFRATRAGIPIHATPDFIGLCTPNTQAAAWIRPGLSPAQRWTHFTGPKGIKARNYWIYARRHGGTLGSLFWMIHMIKGIFTLFFPRPRTTG